MRHVLMQLISALFSLLAAVGRGPDRVLGQTKEKTYGIGILTK